MLFSSNVKCRQYLFEINRSRCIGFIVLSKQPNLLGCISTKSVSKIGSIGFHSLWATLIPDYIVIASLVLSLYKSYVCGYNIVIYSFGCFLSFLSTPLMAHSIYLNMFRSVDYIFIFIRSLSLFPQRILWFLSKQVYCWPH